MGGTVRLEEILSVFRSFDDVGSRSDLLIEFAERYRPVPESMAKHPYNAEHRVPGCESEVYIFPEHLADGTIKFHFAVENPQGISAKGLAAVLDEGLSGQPLDAVSQIEAEFVYEIFGRGLSMGKGRGLMGMVNMVRSLAREKLQSIGR